MDRFSFLKQALPSWLLFPYYEIIIVDWSSKEEDIVPYIKSLNDKRVKIIRVPNQQHFNNGAAWNVGIHYACGELISGVDCDVIISPDVFQDMLPLDPKNFYTGHQFYHTYGTTLFSKAAWASVEGYTEIFRTWSQEDVLFYRSLQQAGYIHTFFPLNKLKHIDHDNTTRFKNSEFKGDYSPD